MNYYQLEYMYICKEGYISNVLIRILIQDEIFAQKLKKKLTTKKWLNRFSFWLIKILEKNVLNILIENENAEISFIYSFENIFCKFFKSSWTSLWDYNRLIVMAITSFMFLFNMDHILCSNTQLKNSKKIYWAKSLIIY